MRATEIDIRPAGQADLEAIKQVIEAAVMTWHLPDRVKRLSLPAYRYDSMGLVHLDILLAEDSRQNIIGIAAREHRESRAGSKELSLHGIYVDPLHHRQGIGSKLFRVVEEGVRKHVFNGLLLKAQQGSNGFFISQGMQRLQADDPLHQYANRFCKSAASIMISPD